MAWQWVTASLLDWKHIMCCVHCSQGLKYATSHSCSENFLLGAGLGTSLLYQHYMQASVWVTPRGIL